MRPMRHATSLAIAVCLLSWEAQSQLSLAAEASKDDHHPAASAAAKNEGTPSAASMSEMMQQMQTMHEKMMAAKTPAERQALMADHMKTMQQGMAMLQMMNSQSGKGPMSSQMMGKRMDMMTTMMQMMMDQHPMGGMSMGAMPMGTTPPAPSANAPPK